MRFPKYMAQHLCLQAWVVLLGETHGPCPRISARIVPVLDTWAHGPWLGSWCFPASQDSWAWSGCNLLGCVFFSWRTQICIQCWYWKWISPFFTSSSVKQDFQRCFASFLPSFCLGHPDICPMWVLKMDQSLRCSILCEARFSKAFLHPSSPSFCLHHTALMNQVFSSACAAWFSQVAPSGKVTDISFAAAPSR